MALLGALAFSIVFWWAGMLLLPILGVDLDMGRTVGILGGGFLIGLFLFRDQIISRKPAKGKEDSNA